MTISALSLHQTSILADFGLGLLPSGKVALVDAHQAENGHIHHTFMPIAAVGWSLAAPAIAARRLTQETLCDLVVKRFNMSCDTADVFAAACGLRVSGPYYAREAQFCRHLCLILNKYGLGAFFGHYPNEGAFHLAIRPRGIDWTNGSKTLPTELRRLRSAYRALPSSHQMLVATILWLYGGRDDSFWLRGLPRSWNAVQAVLELDNAGILKDWAELVTRYPGW